MTERPPYIIEIDGDLPRIRVFPADIEAVRARFLTDTRVRWTNYGRYAHAIPPCDEMTIMERDQRYRNVLSGNHDPEPPATIEAYDLRLRRFFYRFRQSADLCSPTDPNVKTWQTIYGFLWAPQEPLLWLHSQEPYAVAFRLLMDHLSPQQRDSLLSRGWFYERASNRTIFKVHTCRITHNVVSSDGQTAWCTANYAVPMFDTILTQVLLLRTDATRFLQIGYPAENCGIQTG